jgi:hypothetical protein
LTTLQDALRELVGLPGSMYSCVADRDTGRVVAELAAEISHGGLSGAFPTVSGAALSWGADAARFLAAAAGDDLEDLIVTSRRAYHLVRQIDSGVTAPMLVYLGLDRRRSNLALARRQLAATQLGERGPTATHKARTLPPQPLSPAVEQAGATMGASAPSSAPAGGIAVLPPVSYPRSLIVDRAPPITDGPVVPLPRRSPAALPPPSVPLPMEATALPVARWANDIDTMRLLLDGLRKLR